MTRALMTFTAMLLLTTAAGAQGLVEKAKQAETLSAQGKYLAAIQALDEATTALWQKSPLMFRRALWVAEPPHGFGIFNPRENDIFAPGAPMIAYAEPIGFAWKKVGDLWHMDLAIDVVIKSKDGKVVAERKDFQKLQLSSRVRNREFMARITYTFSGLPAGPYLVDTILRDKVSGKHGTFTLPFEVK